MEARLHLLYSMFLTMSAQATLATLSQSLLPLLLTRLPSHVLVVTTAARLIGIECSGTGVALRCARVHKRTVAEWWRVTGRREWRDGC